MTDGDRRRGGGSAPDPSQTLPFGATLGPADEAFAPTVHSDASAPQGTLDLPASDQVAAPGAFDPGQMIGRFVVRSRLGEGGMGVVLAGHDADLGRAVAIKLVRGEVDQPAYRARLLREAQAMARLEHPNVARVYEVGSDRGRLFVAMELVDGVTLATWLRVQRRPWREIVAMFQQVGAGLAAVHRGGLIHRDFKPDNVLVDRDGRARVVDFGLARLDRDATATNSPELAASLTRTGAMMGTPGYMAPEQQFGGSVDARVDQYSFCVALREALLGGRQPRADDDSDWGGTPRPIRVAIMRGLAYEPSERFPSMDDLLVALRGPGRRGAAIGAAIAGSVVTVGVIVAIAATSARSSAPAGIVPADAVQVAELADVALAHPDAGVVVVERAVGPGDLDAGTVVLATVADAGSARTVERRRPASPPRVANVSIDAGVAAAPPSATTSPPITVVQRPPKLPAASVSDPGHLAVVRATIKDLGYDGFDPKVTAADVEQLTDLEQAIAKVKLGMIERKRGRCRAAETLWTSVVNEHKRHWNEAGFKEWYARAHMGLALCALASGNRNAQDLANGAWVNGNQDQLRLVIALAVYEQANDPQLAYGLFLVAMRVTEPAVQSGLKTWLTGTGLTLP